MYNTIIGMEDTMSKSHQFITKADLILIILLFVTGISLTLFIYWPRSSENSILEVRQNGNTLMTLPLDKSTEQTITDEDGHQNHFTIQDGTVTMTDANCHDQTCVKTRAISTPGQSIVCLPHRLVLTIKEKESSDSSLDAVVQ